MGIQMSNQPLYPQFTWWQGIVEDRYDPDKLGRYKVRIFGYHTNDKTRMPTEDLPWAIPMQPVTSAAISGVGTSANGLVEGSAVIGFFADGPDGQIPILMGSWGCMSFLPEDANGEVVGFDRSKSGFYDPSGTYPRQKEIDAEIGSETFGQKIDVGKNILKEPDSSRLARGAESSEQHFSLQVKRDTLVTGIGKAFAPKMTIYDLPETSITHPNTDATPAPKYTQEFWNEPDPQGAKVSVSQYPHNKVTETESGHIFEVDDTPDAGRIHQMHNSGTYEEIQPDGTRAVKIVSDDYEIIIGGKNLLIKGDFNITVEGDYNLNVLGNKYEDIQGHSFESVRGSKVTKVQGNRVDENMSDEAVLTVKNKWETVQCNSGAGVYSKRVGGKYIKAIGKETTVTYGQGINTVVSGDYKLTTVPSFGVEVTEEGIKPVITYGDFIVFTTGDVTLGTQLTPNFNGTFPTVSLQSAYINTMGTMGHLEAIGIVPVVPPAPGQIVGKRIMNSVTSAIAYEEIIAVGNAVRTVTLGNVVDTVTAGTYNITATAAVNVSSTNFTTNILGTAIVGTTNGISLAAATINLN